MKLKNSSDILDALSRALGDVSDYRISRELGIPPQAVSAVRTGRRGLSRQQCKAAAKILDVEPGALITIVAAEREDDAALRASMLKVAARGMAAAALIGVGLAGAPLPASAATNCGNAAGDSVYYVKSRRRWSRVRPRRAAAPQVLETQTLTTAGTRLTRPRVAGAVTHSDH